MDNDTEPESIWTARHELASRAMLAFIANAGQDPEQPTLHLPTVAASAVAMADAMLAAMDAPAAQVPDLAELAKATGSEILAHYEAAHGNLQYWQQRAQAAEALLVEQAETIVAQPHDRRTH